MVVNAQVNEANKTPLRSARRSVVEKGLTGPTLLEMSGSGTGMRLGGFGGLWPPGGGEPPPGKIGTIGTMGTNPPGVTGGESYGGGRGTVGGGTTGSSNSAGGGSSGEDGVTGPSEMRLPQRVLEVFFPSVTSVSPLESVNFFLVQ